MLSRRNIRTKVMQSVYANEQGAYTSLAVAEKNLLKSINNVYTLFIYNLYLVREVCLYANKVAIIKQSKHRPTEADLNFSTEITQNKVIVALTENKQFNKLVADNKFDSFINEDVIKQLFTEFSGLADYINYTNNTDKVLAADRKLIKRLYNKVMSKNEQLDSHIEERFPFAYDDMHVVKFKVNEFINSFEDSASISLIPKTANTTEDKEFASQLFKLTVEKDPYFMELIAPKLKNWDSDRLAKIDVILLKMAVCELIYFKYIPIKVTINEYIDISKLYSTPKSKDFINGVLDKLMRELKDDGTIKKAGRGLMG